MSTITDWDLFQSLHAVLEAGSLSAAARTRGLTQPTIGRHIEALEQRLGAPLFLRSPRGIQPTDLALELRTHLQDMAASAAAALRDAAGARDSAVGAVRITASEVVGAHVLPAILTDFHRRHPDIDIELVLSNESDDLARREADIAVRMTPPLQAALVAKKVGQVEIAFHAAPAYLADHGVPRTLAELQAQALIGFDKAPSIRRAPGLDMDITRDLFALRTDSDLAQLAAIRAGFGVGVCQVGLARRYGLVRVLPELTLFSLGIWIVMHENLKASRRMRLMFDHLVAGLSAYVAEGRES